MNLILRIFTVVVTSLFFFPFFPMFMPMVNTKMILAAIGLIALALDWVNKKDAMVNRDMFFLTLAAMFVGILSFISETYHETGGSVYTTLFVSMWVWVGAAYTVSLLIKKVHGKVTVRLFFNYVIVVCVLQCLIAVAKEYYAPLKLFVDNLVTGEAFMGKAEGRLYGIGAALDVAGLRFSGVLTIITYLCLHPEKDEDIKNIRWYISAFFIIIVFGCMMSRSTTIGVIISLAYLFYMSVFNNKNVALKYYWKCFSFSLGVIIPASIILYNVNDTFYENIRFGFEGFFNWYEQGSYSTNSNNILLNMIILPDNFQTWLFGDGYIVKPELVNPYYTGPQYLGFYKDTDIGYLLFIYYFGLIGMFSMVIYICTAARLCIRRFPMYKILFIMILAVNLIGWCKVTTDIFVVFAPFMILPVCDGLSKDENQLVL